MSRKLASIQRIWKIEPIEGADRIELAYVLGWKCVVDKGSFQPMDLAVYFEVDSFLPVKPEFEFLRKSSYKSSEIMGEGFRLRTVKLRGQISQGLLLPLSILPIGDYELNQDVTSILGVKKWEEEERATTAGTIIGGRPSFIPLTDETRVQAMPELIDAFGDLIFYITTKMDGASHSIGIDETGIHVCSRNCEMKDDGKNAFYEMVKRNELPKKMRKYMNTSGVKSLVLQGELCAPGIQSNRLKLKAPQWYVFTVISDGDRVSLEEMMYVCDILGLKHVPIEEIGKDLKSKYPNVEAVLARADGTYPNGGPKEGIVIRPVDPVRCKLLDGNYLSMKAVSNKYLLKCND